MIGTAECATLEALRFVQRASADETRLAIDERHVIERWRARTS